MPIVTALGFTAYMYINIFTFLKSIVIIVCKLKGTLHNFSKSYEYLSSILYCRLINNMFFFGPGRKQCVEKPSYSMNFISSSLSLWVKTHLVINDLSSWSYWSLMDDIYLFEQVNNSQFNAYYITSICKAAPDLICCVDLLCL